MNNACKKYSGANKRSQVNTTVTCKNFSKVY